MGKRITQQARGKGSLTFRVKPKAYRHKINYPLLSYEGVGKIVKLFNSAGHSAPLVKIELTSTTLLDYNNISNLYKDKTSNQVDESKSKQISELSQASKSGSEVVKDTNNKEGGDKNFKGSEQINKKQKTIFTIPAADGVYEGQEIYIGKRPENKKAEVGDIIMLKNINQGTKIFNIENTPGKGGKLLRSAGSSAVVSVKDGKSVEIIIRRRKLKLNENCRAVIGSAAGEGRKMKPLVKAGKSHYINKAKGRKWHRTSAIKVNAIDHPFGSGRGKRIKSKIAKRNSPPGLKVGHIRPKRTGKRK